MKKERESFEYQWNRVYKQRFTSTPMDIAKIEAEFLGTSGISTEWIGGKKVLDMGCGPGRLSFALKSLGARVVAVDFVGACLKSIKKKSSKIDTVEADFNSLPFKEASFNLIICVGVLHHTPAPKENFMKLVPLLKKGGVMHIMVYERYNPIKLWLTDRLRKMIGGMTYEKRMMICRKTAALNYYPGINKLAMLFIDVPHTAMSTFDRYSNQYHSHHTEK